MADVNQSRLKELNTGIPVPGDACVVIVRTEWNAAIVDDLEKGCLEELRRLGVKKVLTVTVPGAVEIPFTIQRFWEETGKKKRPDAFVALGCVIRGDTPHFEFVCHSVTEGVLRLNLSLPVPVIFGVLTVDKEEQARERIGGLHGHKGEEADVSAVKMIALNRSLSKKPD